MRFSIEVACFQGSDLTRHNNDDQRLFFQHLSGTKRKSLLVALEKIKEGEKSDIWSSVLSSRFYPCALEIDLKRVRHIFVATQSLNGSIPREHNNDEIREYCPEGRESFASYESLEQLHRLIFVLGVTHVLYSFIAIALAMIKIYDWRTWENEAKCNDPTFRIKLRSLLSAKTRPQNTKFITNRSSTQNHKTKYSNKIHQRKHKENQTRPYGLHASFLPLDGLLLAIPIPEKLKKRKGSSGSVERTYQSRDPEGYTYQSSDPEGCTYQSSALEGCTYQSSAPGGCTYQSSAPAGCTYQSSAPEGCTYP
ncbi:mildew resistance protein [Cucumis melo var. makuwa]|uniref:Mildew resistance protein n=1 Tax=Cucumis melo var. makuwa TaxID=1194695 RepID=A0A5A7SQP9_CUCMM|nr:mildew resistance protein [Cucumis melo var. makuwa]TYK19607.1 mildew resistance protein [Cucumis melo var. makuwa]